MAKLQINDDTLFELRENKNSKMFNFDQLRLVTFGQLIRSIDGEIFRKSGQMIWIGFKLLNKAIN